MIPWRYRAFSWADGMSLRYLPQDWQDGKNGCESREFGEFLSARSRNKLKLQPSSQPASTRLISIDALRGIAAIGVVLFHGLNTNSFVVRLGNHGLIFNTTALLFSYGYTGVFLFFVISGFCIHLRWAKAVASGKTPDTDFIGFWKRRIRRLYPAYLVALLIYMLVLATEGKLSATWFTVYDTTMHLLMLHNLDIRTCYSLNGVFWTLAIEEQLYLAYFLLLYLRNKLGWARVLAICLLGRFGWFAICAVLHLLFRIETPASEAAISNWFVWALGAVGVEAAFGLIQLPAWCRNWLLGAVTLCVAAGLEYAARVLAHVGRFNDVVWLITQP